MELIEYELDAEDRILRVAGGWDAFARANDGQALTGTAVLGRSFWAYISGFEVQAILKQLFARVRASGRKWSFPFRCDAPGFRRFLIMELEPAAGGNLSITTRLVKEEEREPLPLLDPKSRRSRERLRMCSWCNRFAIPEWVFAEEVVVGLDLFSEPTFPVITHGICPACESRFAESLDGAGVAQEPGEQTAPGQGGASEGRPCLPTRQHAPRSNGQLR
jgi:hypothetical protein